MLTDHYQDKLPPNFANKIIQLQSLLDDQLTMNLITDLNQLYRIGIDHYIKCQPRKANHFKKKMTKLLTDPMTLDVIQNKASNGCKTTYQMGMRSKIRQQIAKFTNCSNQYIKIILQKSDKAVLKGQALVENQLNKQKQQLQHRIFLKKVKSQEKLIKITHAIQMR